LCGKKSSSEARGPSLSSHSTKNHIHTVLHAHITKRSYLSEEVSLNRSVYE
ncbi:MAG: hypothetical protein ACI956_000786, partial [Nonlabens sp.]